MEKKGTVIIGHWNCPVCGKATPVKKSLRGRLSMVCKWQDDGCGSQLQTLTADASMMMLKNVRREDQEKAQQPEPEKVKTKKEKKPAKAPSVSESSGFGGLF